VPSAVGPVKALLLEADTTKIQPLVASLIDKLDGAASVREKLAAFPSAEGLPI